MKIFYNNSMTDPLFNPESLKKNLNWFAEPFKVKDPALLELRKQCEASFPKNRAAGLAFVAMKRVQAEVTPNYKTVYAWGYSYYLATYRGFQRYGRNPVSNPMHTYWTESNTEYLRLRFLIEADNGTVLIAHVRQSDLIKLGRRLMKAYP